MRDLLIAVVLPWAAVAVGLKAGCDIGYKEAEEKATKAAQVQMQNNAKEMEKREREFSDAVAQRDRTIAALRGTVSDLDGDLERMRRAEVRAITVPASADNPADPSRVELTACRRLLVQSAELLRESAELLGSTSADKDAIVKMIGEQTQKAQ